MQEHDPGPDSVLIARFLGGEAAAFESLINPHRQRLYSYLCRMIDDSEAAKDLLQDVLVKVLQALPQYREQQKFSSWLFSIAHNLAMNDLQKRKRRSTVISENAFAAAAAGCSDEAFSPEEILQKNELKEILESAIAKLPIEQKQILLLREYSGLPFKEIAAMLDCPLNTVLGRMRYALLNLRKTIRQEIGGDISNVL